MTLSLTKPTEGATSWASDVNQNFTDIEDAVDTNVVPSTADGRLSASAGTSVPTSDVTAATTIYYLPYVGRKVALYDGTNWNYFDFGVSVLSKSLSALSATTNYDLFLYDNAGTLTLETLAWSSATARATLLTYQDGVLVKSGASTRRYMGTIRTVAAGQTEDSQAKRFVFNAQNRVPRRSFSQDTTYNWTYASGSFAAANSGNAVWKREFLVGIDEAEPVKADVHLYSIPPGGGYCSVSIGLDSTGVAATGASVNYRPWQGEQIASFTGYLGVGYHYLNGIHKVSGGTATFYGRITVDVLESAMLAECWA